MTVSNVNGQARTDIAVLVQRLNDHEKRAREDWENIIEKLAEAKAQVKENAEEAQRNAREAKMIARQNSQTLNTIKTEMAVAQVKMDNGSKRFVALIAAAASIFAAGLTALVQILIH